MKQLVEFFEAILLSVGSYPATMAYSLFAPKKLFENNSDTLICPPSLTIAISVFLYWHTKRLSQHLIFPEGIPKFGHIELNTLLLTLTILAIVIAAMRYTLKNIFSFKTDLGNPIDELKALSYPVSFSLFAIATFTIIGINFPEESLSIANYIDSESKLPTTNTPVYLKIYNSIYELSFQAGILLCFASLFRIIRTIYSTTIFKSFASTIACLVTTILLTFLLIGIETKTSKSIKNFHIKYKLLKGNTENKTG